MKRLKDILRLDEVISNDTPRNRRFTEYKHNSPHVKDPTFEDPDYELRYQYQIGKKDKNSGHFEATLVHKETGMTHLSIEGKIKKFRSGVRTLSDVMLFGAKTLGGHEINTGLSDKVFEHMNKLNITTVHDNQSDGADKVETKLIRQNPDLIYHLFDPVTGKATPGRKRISYHGARRLGNLGKTEMRKVKIRELPKKTQHPYEVRRNFWNKIEALARAEK